MVPIHIFIWFIFQLVQNSSTFVAFKSKEEIKPVMYEPWDYCNCKCQGYRTNSVCSNARSCTSSTLGINRKVCEDLEFQVISPDDQDVILETINVFRNATAGGQIKIHPKGLTSSNMNALAYSTDLGFAAQCWANSCRKSEVAECVATPDHPQVGQLVYFQSNIEPDWTVSLYYQAFFLWMELLDDVDGPFNDYRGQPWSFVWLIWPETKYIGCAKAYFDESMSFVCNFAPPPRIGIFLDGEPPGSGCRNKSTWFKNLCLAESAPTLGYKDSAYKNLNQNYLLSYIWILYYAIFNWF